MYLIIRVRSRPKLLIRNEGNSGANGTVAQQNIETQLLFSSNLRSDFNLNLRNLRLLHLSLYGAHMMLFAPEASPSSATRFTIILLEGRSGHFSPRNYLKGAIIASTGPQSRHG
ncbi:hypothetical protein Zmor_012965 [Zophobas morio]|uniref:Uncharacterized protein n=1 Tax=Zophobas morio TaxID=2755281 RepID=A0AA38I9X8_9CUCU|nr:hypothetical protein Zmor_012965 [Zophobas morio]